ncbi:MAG: hypothetical protein ACLQBQ_03690 [Smithella sp.]
MLSSKQIGFDVVQGTRHTFGVFLIILVLTTLFVVGVEEPPLKNDEFIKLRNRHRGTSNHPQDKKREGGQV